MEGFTDWLSVKFIYMNLHDSLMLSCADV